jgi:hypothetical protein
VSAEHLAVLAVAMLGAVGMGSLGRATGVAIAGSSRGHANQAAMLAPLSAQAGAAKALVSAADGLYAGVVAKAHPPKRYSRLTNALPTLIRTASQGIYRSLAEFGGGNWTGSTYSNVVAAQVTYPIYYAERAAQSIRSPAGKALVERIRIADKIYRDGATAEEFEAAFGAYSRGFSGAHAAAATDELAEFLGAFEGPTSPVTVFEWQYLANPERALSALTEEARGYLEAEVLPILRATYAKKDESLRYLTDEGEARVMARLVRGDVDGAKKALTAAKRAGMPGIAGDMAEAVTFASRLFSGGDASFGSCAPSPRKRPARSSASRTT